MIVPAGTKAVYQSTNGWKNFTKIVEVGEGGVVGSIFESNGIRYTIDENNTASLISPNEAISGALVIPNQVDFNGKKYDVTSFGKEAFRGCSGLTSVTIPNSVTTIGDGAFSYCSALTSVTIPNSVTSIGSSAFFYCRSLTTVTIPNSVTFIGNNGFGTFINGSLTSVTVDIQEPLVIFYDTFAKNANATLYVPKGSKEAYSNANYWKEFKSINEFVKDEDVILVIKDDQSVTATTAKDPTEKDVVIPERVMIDGEPHSVTAIGDGAFKDNTSLTLVCIPETIEEIGVDAFAGCSSLTAIYSYSENPFPLANANATVRTRADGDEIVASAVFAEVDKETCILYVPKNCSDKYRNADGWKEFKNVVEIESSELGDANNDAKVDGKDIDATVDYIMEGKTENFIFMNADVKSDSKINAVDIVEIVKIKK